MNDFDGRLGVQQRVLPEYRVPFFDMLASHCDQGMSLFAGLARGSESIEPGQTRVARYQPAQNIHLLGGRAYLCYQRGFMDWLARWDPNALIVEANARYLSTPAAVRWMHDRERKVIGWGLGVTAGSATHCKRFFTQFDALISYSRRGALEYAALGFPRDKIFIAQNAVAPSPTSKPSTKPPRIDRATILFVGRLQARKRIDDLIRACAELKPAPRLVIVGDGPERTALENLALEIFPAAEFVGAKHGDQTRTYFEQADVFVLPGTGGLAVQQAMSYGLPVIVAEGDGTQDDLVRAGNGWQIPAGNYDALLGTMKNALSDTARLRAMGEESFRIVSEEINLEKMVDVFITALNSS